MKQRLYHLLSSFLMGEITLLLCLPIGMCVIPLVLGTSDTVSFPLLFLAALIFGALHAVLEVYMAIVLGCQARKNRILLGIGVYIGLSMAEQFLMSIAIVSMALMPDFTMALLYLFGFRQADPDTIYAVLELFLTGVLVFELVIGGVYYFVVRRMLIHRLNLE